MELETLNLSEEQLAGVQQILQSEGDKIRTKYSNELRTVKEELNQYKPAQKSDAEIQYENRIKELEAREQKLLAKERQAELSTKLTELGLPTELGQYLNLGEDVDAGLEAVSVAINGYLLNNGNKPSNHSFSLCFDSFVTFIVTKGVLKCKIYLCIFIKTIVI